MQSKRVKVKLFGSFSVLSGGNLVLEQLAQAKKTCLFLEYLILKKGQPVTHEELLGALWSERDSRNPATALRTLLHRYRNLVEQSGIPELKNSVLTVRGGYRWNPELPIEVDIYEFERLCREASDKKLSDTARISRYDALIDLYAGPLLKSSAREPWIAAKSVYYHDLYIESTFALIELLEARAQNDRIIQVCRRAMDVDLFDERLHLAYTLALTRSGKKHEALSQYYFVSKLHDASAGEEPSDALREIGRHIAQADSATEADIDRVEEILSADAAGDGAFVCPYNIFHDIYQMQRRTLSRYNGTMFLALMSVCSTDGSIIEGYELEQVMGALLATAHKNLRCGDTICRYSALQFAVLLPAVTYESGRGVLERIKQAFYEINPEPQVMLTYRLRALEMQACKCD